MITIAFDIFESFSHHFCGSGRPPQMRLKNWNFDQFSIFNILLYTSGILINFQYLSDPGKPGVQSLGLDVRPSLRHLCENFTDVTLADEDTKDTKAM